MRINFSLIRANVFVLKTFLNFGKNVVIYKKNKNYSVKSMVF